MSTPMSYTGFESKRSAVEFAIKALRENNLVTPDAEWFREDEFWASVPKNDTYKSSYDLATWSSEEDEMYYRATAKLSDYGWEVTIEHINIPTPDMETVYYDSY